MTRTVNGANMLHESYQRKLMMMQHLQHPPAHTKASGAGRKFVYCFCDPYR